MSLVSKESLCSMFDSKSVFADVSSMYLFMFSNLGLVEFNVGEF
jgi:hypothetical protein